MILLLWFVTVLVTISRLCVTWTLPLTGDEAYYWEWSRHLAFGYVDHPPAVAWVVALFAGIGHTAGGVRFGFWLCGVLTTLLAADVARRLALRRCQQGDYVEPAFAAALVGFFLTIAPLVSLAFTTVSPDGPYLLFWVGVLELIFICEANPRLVGSWLGLGLVLGLALMTRAFALILVPTVVFALMRHRKMLIVTLGVAGLVCIPFVLWNAQHHWANLYFTVAGRHVYEGFSLLRPVLSGLIVIAALGIGPGFLAFRFAAYAGARVLWGSAYALAGLFLVVGLFERIEVYWFLGPYLSASIAAAVSLAARHPDRERWLKKTGFLVPFGVAGCLTVLVFGVALAPFQVLSFLQTHTKIHFKNPSVFEIFTYHDLARDVQKLSLTHHVAILTDGYGLSSLLDFEAGVVPTVIGYTWQGREARRWVRSEVVLPNALFVDKEALKERPDFAHRLDLACHRVRPGPNLSYRLPGLPARIYPTTWCDGMLRQGLAILRWERNS